MTQAKKLSLIPAISHDLLILLWNSDIYIYPIATARSFWEWTTSVMNWLLCHLYFPRALIPVDWTASRSIWTLQWIFRQRLRFTWNLGIVQESNLFSILATVSFCSRITQGNFTSVCFFPGTLLSTTPSSISSRNFRGSKLHPRSNLSFRRMAIPERFGVMEEKRISNNQVAEEKISQGNISGH